MKIAYFGYDFFYDCLKTVLSEGHDVIKVFTFDTDNQYNFNTFLKNICEQKAIPAQTSPVTPADIQSLMEDGVDLFLSCAYPYKIPVPDDPRFKGVNTHPSLLPKVRGVWPLPVILLKERESAGLTLHKLSAQWDQGDILLQQAIPLSDEDDLESYSAKCMMRAPNMVRALLADFDRIWSEARPQSGEKTYYTYPTDADKTFDFETSVDDIARVGKAFGRFESLAILDGKRYWIKDFSVWHEPHNIPCGHIVLKANREWCVAAKDGFVCLKDFYEDPTLL